MLHSKKKSKIRTRVSYIRFETFIKKFKDRIPDIILIEILKYVDDMFDNNHIYGSATNAGYAYESLNLIIEDYFPKYAVAEAL